MTGRGASDAAVHVTWAGALPGDRRVVFISRLGRVCSQGSKRAHARGRPLKISPHIPKIYASGGARTTQLVLRAECTSPSPTYEVVTPRLDAEIIDSPVSPVSP